MNRDYTVEAGGVGGAHLGMALELNDSGDRSWGGFDGTVSAEGDRLSGRLDFGANEGPVVLERR